MRSEGGDRIPRGEGPDKKRLAHTWRKGHVTTYKPGREVSPDTQCVSTLNFNFQPWEQ